VTIVTITVIPMWYNVGNQTIIMLTKGKGGFMGPTKARGKISLSSADVVEELKKDKDIMASVLRGVEDCKAGRVRLWSEIKRERGIQ